MLSRLMAWSRRDRTEAAVARQTISVTLSSDDGDVARAINIMRVMGLSLNVTAMAMVPPAAMAIEAYRRLDRDADRQRDPDRG